MIGHRIRLSVLALSLSVGGCAMLGGGPWPDTSGTRDDTGPVASPEPSDRGKPRLRPMKVRPLDVATTCSFKDETGYKGNARVSVRQARVEDFSAHVDIPRRGSCNFEMAEFRQVKTAPHVELAAASGCKVRMWEQGRQITVAFADCRANCSGTAVDYLWPILIDAPSGRCD